jgi:YD repeat-containing protein
VFNLRKIKSLCFLQIRVAFFILICTFGVSNLAVAATTQYNYDALGRLVSTTDPEGVTTDYSYDKAGNLLGVTRRALPTPTIDSFVPTAGIVGQTVTIRGTNFSANLTQNQVKFNGVTAIVTAATSTQLTTSVPMNATTGTISVTTASGTATSAASFTVLIPQPPQITGFSPAVTAPGAVITLAGQNFMTTASSNQVKVNTTNATVNASTDASLTFTAPAATGGKIALTTPYGNTTSQADLFIAPAPYSATNIGATARISMGGPDQVLPIAGGKVGLVLFDGVLGVAAYRIRATGVTLAGGRVKLLNPDGTTLLSNLTFSGGGGSFLLPPLSVAGTYGILVEPSTNIGGSVSIGIGQDLDEPIVIDAQANLNIATAGQIVRMPFSGVVGDNLNLDISAVSINTGSAMISVLNPNGAVIYNNDGNNFFSAGIFTTLPTLTVTGTYTVLITPTNNGIGSFKLAVWSRPKSDGVINTDGTTRTLTMPVRGQGSYVTFAGAVGDSYYLDITALLMSSTYATISVTSPDGTVIFNNGGLILQPSATVLFVKLPTLTIAGAHKILITPINSGSGTVKLAMWTSQPFSSGVVELDGIRKTVTIPLKGQSSYVTFSGTAGDSLFIDWAPISLVSPFAGNVSRISITNPDGTVLFNANNVDSSGGAFKLPTLAATGTYRILFTPAGDGVGTLRVALSTLPLNDGTLATDGSPKTVNIPLLGQSKYVSFTGAVSDSLYLNLSAISFGSGATYISVLKPDGSILFNNNGAFFPNSFASAIKLPALTMAGEYKIVITPLSDSTGSLNLAMWYEISQAGALTLATPTPIAMSLRGQQKHLTFDGVMGENLALSLTAVTLPSGTIQVLSPTGVAVTAVTNFATSGTTLNIPTLTVAGTYIVVIIPSGTSTGALTTTLNTR